MNRDSRKSGQKSAKNMAYFEKNHEKHGKNTASKCIVFLLQKFKLGRTRLSLSHLIAIIIILTKSN